MVVLSFSLENGQSAESPDEECLPFKALHALSFNSRLRLYTEPDSLHSFWNDLKNSYKRADLQPALLLGITLSQMSHGPFTSGSNQYTRVQTAELLSEILTEDEFQALREAMLRDRGGREDYVNHIPEQKEDLPSLAAELDEIRRNYSNKLEMACHYYQDPLLPLEFKAMYWASSAVMREYQSTLEESTLRWRAARSKGQTWFPTVIQTMCSINDAETMKKLHISLERGQHYEVDTTEIELLNKYAVLAIEICSARCWSQSQYTIVLPNVFSLVHHETPQERQRGIRLVKKIWDAVLKAEEFVYGDGMMAADTKDALKQILKDMAWNNTQVTRELYLVCNQAAWQADHAEDELKWTRLEPTANDFTRCVGQTRFSVDEKKRGKTFDIPKAFALPACLRYKPSNLKVVDRSAGTAANHRSAAATAWIISNAVSDFRHAADAWTGCLLLKRKIYQNEKGKAYLCLGFRSYEYIVTKKELATGSLPRWMMNAEITGEGKWQMLPTELRLPCQIPDALSSFGSVWEVVGPPQPLLKSAVKAGVCMTAADLQKIQKILKYPLPPRGKGSGKSGNLVKQDFAEALVNMLWPEDTPEEKKRMVDALMGKTLPRVKCANDVIAAVKELGAEAERDFRELHQVALNQEAVEKERRLRGPNVQERQDQKTFTPHSLRKLLPPGQGRVKGFLDTHAATWDGPVRKLTETQALKECVLDFAWAKHLPTEEMIAAVVSNFDANTGMLDADTGMEEVASSSAAALPKAKGRGRGRSKAMPKASKAAPKAKTGRSRGGRH
ncbi:unnamed protein product [Durusdinium trenchii]|uniref:Uncharacterized protein n=1 Tax=Durusdinium trenchii TaxID=1381693 RepID=A0ABP0I1H9_9DINO